MRIRTIFYLSLGAILLILLLVATAASYKTKKSLDDLKMVVDRHVPSLEILMHTHDVFHDANIMYERFSIGTPVFPAEMILYIDRLKVGVDHIGRSNIDGKIDTTEAFYQLENIGRSLVETGAYSLERKRELRIENQHAFGELRVLLQGWSLHLPITLQKDTFALLGDFSNLLSRAEDAIDLFYSQETIPLSSLLELLQKCLANVHKLAEISRDPLSHLSSEDITRLQKLVASLNRYRAAIVLFNDEKELGVSGANLDEILSAVQLAQEDARLRLHELKSSLVGTINTTQKHIISSNFLLQKLFLAASVFGIFLVISILFVFRNVLSSRIGQLIRGADAFASGDLEYRLNTQPDGDDLSYLAISFNKMADTLHRREMEKTEYLDQLARAQKMEAIGLMAGGVAHDLNNILSGIVSYPDLLLLQLPEESELRRPVEVMRQSGRRAADVVADLLTVARGVASAKETVKLHIIIQEHLNSPEHMNLLSQFPKITFSVQLDNASKNIACSPVHVKKCIMNIVYNAFEAIPNEGSCVLSTRNLTIDNTAAKRFNLEPGDYITVSVQDSGPGVSDEDVQHIFEPFYTKKKMGKSGTGLGLAIVWNTMRDHKGTVIVESSSTGTLFTLYFPVDFNDSPENIESVSQEKTSGNGERILVVDDESQLREIACQILSTLNYDVHAVGSGEEAIEYLRKNTVDLVLLDMFMEPGMSGYKTYEQIVTIHPGQKAIIASGFSKNDAVEKAFQLGVGGYVKKPYSIDEIGLAIKKELNK